MYRYKILSTTVNSVLLPPASSARIRVSGILRTLRFVGKLSVGEMFTPVILFVLVASSTLALQSPSVNEEDISYAAERRGYELFGSYERNRESLIYEHKGTRDKPFSWNDCGDRSAAVRIVNFSISPLPLHPPGAVVVTLNATVNKDIGPPISVEISVKKWSGKKWEDECQHVAGGCNRKDICSSQKQPTAAEEEDGDDDDNEWQNPLCQVKKGFFTLPPTPFTLLTEATPGSYQVKATFRKGTDRFACVVVRVKLIA